jgi:hypothetical protein
MNLSLPNGSGPLARNSAIDGDRTMTCQHLKDLYAMCQAHNLRLSSSELIRIVCTQCGVEDTCPSVLFEEYDTRHQEEGEPSDG